MGGLCALCGGLSTRETPACAVRRSRPRWARPVSTRPIPFGTREKRPGCAHRVPTALQRRRRCRDVARVAAPISTASPSSPQRRGRRSTSAPPSRRRQAPRGGRG